MIMKDPGKVGAGRGGSDPVAGSVGLAAVGGHAAVGVFEVPGGDAADVGGDDGLILGRPLVDLPPIQHRLAVPSVQPCDLHSRGTDPGPLATTAGDLVQHQETGGDGRSTEVGQPGSAGTLES